MCIYIFNIYIYIHIFNIYIYIFNIYIVDYIMTRVIAYVSLDNQPSYRGS